MKKITGILLAVCICLSFAGCSQSTSSATAKFKSGTYTATARGKIGDVTVEVEFTDNEIKAVTITEENETESIASGALESVPQAIVDTQSTKVDTVSGATVTSNAIIEAVNDCIRQAGADPDALTATDVSYSKTMRAGTYTATKHGHHSDVTVEVKVSEEAIESVAVTEEGETYILADGAISDVPRRIVAHQSVSVDTVAGATYTSQAIISAVKDCLAQAGSEETVKAFSTTAHEVYDIKDITVDCDIVVAGSGLTGISAALSAQEQGANVYLIEKLPYVGGISQTAGGGLAIPSNNGTNTRDYIKYRQTQDAGIFKNTYTDTEHPDTAMVTALAENSYEAYKWLEGNGILNFTVDSLYQGLTTTYAIWSMSYEGYTQPDVTSKAFEVLYQRFEELGGTIITELSAEHVIMTDGKVSGLTASGNAGNYTFNCHAVILATGGFASSPEMIEKYAPAYAGEDTMSSSGNTGDAITMGLEVGAAVYESGYLMGGSGQTFKNDSEMISPYNDYTTPRSCIYVNPIGLRVNSEDPVSYTDSAVYVNPDAQDYYWAIINRAQAEATGYIQYINDAESWGVETYKAETIDELANLIRIPAPNLRYTVNTYNRYCRNGVDEDYGKSIDYLVEMSEGPYYAVKATMMYFGSVGGVVTNPDANVVDTNGNAITGLYAAGEASNGAIFNMNYGGGFSLADCLTFGRIAGLNAAELSAK